MQYGRCPGGLISIEAYYNKELVILAKRFVLFGYVGPVCRWYVCLGLSRESSLKTSPLKPAFNLLLRLIPLVEGAITLYDAPPSSY